MVGDKDMVVVVVGMVGDKGMVVVAGMVSDKGIVVVVGMVGDKGMVVVAGMVSDKGIVVVVVVVAGMLYRLCTFQILIENQLVRRLAEKDYSAGIEGYWYQYFKRVCSMKEMIIHQKWYKMLFLMHKKMPKIIHQKWYLMLQSSQHKKIPQMNIIFSQLQYADRAVFVFPDMMS
ncbi:hypothetical protein Pcinc_013393 [Petrolisthes cinctipes]|uniref:Uncharacterized protein n=1 Tax=Petrolisthes cinctipes TaxID=88211 RepID=A0AAE1FYN1_PETCI|nr:hypothetical protein Pcinc_013387 [Petrolisthes cinctipes]KAK3882220.1 hypothetical protein Pcinc_013393 [Petrolisthes cinctipes]